MSVLLFSASDTPLAEVKNPHYKTLSVNEALAAGMNDIPDFMLELSLIEIVLEPFCGRIPKSKLTQITTVLMMDNLMMTSQY